MKLLCCLILMTANLYAGEHSLKAHVHGELKMDMAIDKTVMELDIDGPAESFLGFEYIPKTAKDKKILEDAKSLWEKNLLSVFELPKTLNCTLTESTFSQVSEGKAHSDVEARAKISCAKPLAGSTLKVGMKKAFTHIQKMKIDIVGDVTKSITITHPVEEVKL